MPEFCEHLKRVRKTKGSTQKQVAEYLGIAERSYQKLEAGVSKPSFDSLLALAEYFDVSIDYLVGRTENPRRL